MIRKLTFAIALLSTGCTTLDTAPIVFSSRQAGGIDVRTVVAEGSTPGVTIGFYNADFAWVPAVGADRSGKPKALLAEDSDGKDIASVYSQFDGSFFANIRDGDVAKQGLGKVFAVGIAAQNITNQQAARMRNSCMESAVELVNLAIKDTALAAKKPGMISALQTKCSNVPAGH